MSWPDGTESLMVALVVERSWLDDVPTETSAQLREKVTAARADIDRLLSSLARLWSELAGLDEDVLDASEPER